MKEGGQNFCLGMPAHLVDQGEVICRQCGTLVQDTLVGPYQIKRFLRNERGNWAYLASYHNQASPVLVKLFSPDPISQHLWERAWQELRLLADLRHPGMLPMLDGALWNPASSSPLKFGEGQRLSLDEQTWTFLVVAYQYTPLTFQYLLRSNVTVSPQSALDTARRLFLIIEQMTATLALAHGLGTVHGALTPDNILLSAQLDHAWIADFGVGRLQLPQVPFLAPEMVAVSKLCEQRRDISLYWDALTEACDQYMLAVLCSQLFLHMLPQEMFQRVQPVLRQAVQPEPEWRFPRISDFSSALAAAFGIDQAFRQGSKQQNPPYPMPGKEQAPPPLPATSSAEPLPPTPLQQANQLEQKAGKHFTAHDYAGAREAYLQALTLDATRISALLGLADTCFALERYTEALEIYGKILQLDPNNTEAWYNQATVFDLLGLSHQATYSYEHAERLKAESERRSK